MRQYDVILADPPWRYEVWSRSSTTRPEHYPRMTIGELSQLPVSELAAHDCALFLWVVDWLRPSDLEAVMEAWGFEYRTRAWAWVKARRTGFGFFVGMGHYTRANPEDCWLGVRGTMPVADRGVLSLIYAPVREHSRKPDEQYEKIERLYPGRRYLELFARRKRAGWDAWGKEVQCDVEIVA